MAFPQSFMDELVARSDIVDICRQLCAADCQGRELLGLLPLPQ